MNNIQYIQNMEMIFIFIVLVVFVSSIGKLEKRLEDEHPTIKIDGCLRPLIWISLCIGFMVIQLILIALVIPNIYGEIYLPFTFMVSFILSSLILYNYEKHIYK